MSERLIYVPLGGAGEIGMNMYAYGWGAPGQEDWILVDTGVTFPNMETSPGVDLITADPSFIATRRDRLHGIFITHAHEDHVGALGMLWHRLEAPIFTRKFTGLVAADKLDRYGLSSEHVFPQPPMPEMMQFGPFRVGFLPVSHSIPEASALVIDTPAGRVVHSGDLKLDPDPQVGEAFDPAAFEAVAGDGILALVCDSTNVFNKEPGRSEASIVADITSLMKDASGMVVATTFASNIARLRTLAKAAVAADRSVLVLGRAMNRMLAFARTADVLADFPNTISVDDVENVPRDHLFVLATGSQGEMRAASAQLSREKYLGLELAEGDTFLFSSKTIPGNEVSVGRIINNLAEKGVTVVEEDPRYHVSGHANRPDIQELHRLFNPALVVPMHGEYRHLREHAQLARAGGRKSVIAPNGTVVDLSEHPGTLIDQVETGRMYLDGSVMIGAMDGIVRERIRMAIRGHVAVSVIIDEDGRPLDGVWAVASGLADPEHDTFEELVEAGVETALSRAKKSVFASDDAVEELVTRAVNRAGKDHLGKKPICKVMINRLAPG